MRIDYLCIIDKVTAKSITVEVANIERPFNVEWKDSLIMSVKIRWTGTAYDFCNYVMEHGHKTNVITGSGDTFENLIMTEVIRIPDNQGCWCKDELELKFTHARENENTNKDKEDTTMKTFKLLSGIGKSVIKKNVVVEGIYKADCDLKEHDIKLNDYELILHTKKYKNIGVCPYANYYLSDGESEMEIRITEKLLPDDNRIWKFKVLY